MGMAVQIDPALAHTAPAAQRVMAEDEANAVGLDLEIGLDALPALELPRRQGVVVAGDEMLVAIEASEELRDHARALANSKIAEVPDHVIRFDRLVPSLDQGFVHRRNRREGPLVEAQSTAVTKMCIAREEDRHAAPPISLPHNTPAYVP